MINALLAKTVTMNNQDNAKNVTFLAKLAPIIPPVMIASYNILNPETNV